MMHAAALGGWTMREVAQWVRDPEATDPHAILADHEDAAEGWAHELEAMCALETGAAARHRRVRVGGPVVDVRPGPRRYRVPGAG